MVQGEDTPGVAAGSRPPADFATFWARHAEPNLPKFRSYVRRRIPPCLEVDEIVNNFFLRVRDLWDQGKPGHDNVIGWLWVVLRNVVAEAIRGVIRDRDRFGPLDEDRHANVAIRGSRSLTDELVQCLSRLPARARRLVLRHVLAGLTFKTLASELKRTLGQVSYQYYQALATLRQCLDSKL
jgi:RNA polymerase sigma factor (sigma-70 family)